MKASISCGYVALGTIDSFREGWAIIPFVEKPHYWHDVSFTDEYRAYESNCGLLRGLRGEQKPIVPGNFPKCKRCEKATTQ